MPDYVTIAIGEVDAIRSTVSFLSSVIRAGEPYTPEVKQAVENAFTRTARWVQDARNEPQEQS